MKHLIFVICFLVLFASCNQDTNTRQKPKAEIELGELSSSEYAKGFETIQMQHYSLIRFINPWENHKILSEIIITNHPETLTDSLKKNYRIIKTPIKSIACFSTTHIGYLDALNSLNLIKGIGDPDRVFNSKIREGVKNGSIQNLGSNIRIDLEKTYHLSPDLILLSGFEKMNPEEEQMLQAGLPVLFTTEWMEKSLLGRAEWIKLFALLLGKEAEGKNYFKQVESEYQALTTLIKNKESSLNVMCGSMFSGTWYMPGGESYIAQLFKALNIQYTWSDSDQQGSIPLSFEVVYENHLNSDIWLMPGTASQLDELADQEEKYKVFKAYKNQQVYNNTRRTTKTGGNDWWESAVVHPEICLRDMICIFYPDVLNQCTPYYFEKLK